jgi:hypothetical protein
MVEELDQRSPPRTRARRVYQPFDMQNGYSSSSSRGLRDRVAEDGDVKGMKNVIMGSASTIIWVSRRDRCGSRYSRQSKPGTKRQSGNARGSKVIQAFTRRIVYLADPELYSFESVSRI